MIILDLTLSHTKPATAKAVPQPAVCGAGLFALIALVVVIWVVSRCAAIVGEDRTPGASLSIPSDPVMNPLILVLAHYVHGTLPAASTLEVMP